MVPTTPEIYIAAMHHKLNACEASVLHAIRKPMSMDFKQQSCWYSRATYAELTRYSVSTVGRALKSLEGQKAIRRVGKKHSGRGKPLIEYKFCRAWFIAALKDSNTVDLM